MKDVSHFKEGAVATCSQGCQIFLGTNIPKREKYTKGPQTTPNGHGYIISNGHKLYQMAEKFPTFSIPKLGFLVLK
jgi:hypothetical protein